MHISLSCCDAKNLHKLLEHILLNRSTNLTADYHISDSQIPGQLEK